MRAESSLVQVTGSNLTYVYIVLAISLGALAIAAFAYRYARRHARDPRFAFGTGKLGDLAGFTSAIVLAMVSVGIVWESVVRLFNRNTANFKPLLVHEEVEAGSSATLLPGSMLHYSYADCRDVIARSLRYAPLKARVMQDSPARTEIYKKLARMIVEDCPVIFGVHRIGVALRQAWLKNDMIDEFPFARSKYVKIDLEAVARHIAEVAAEEIMPRFGRLAAGDVDGALVGGASLKADEFLAIAKAA